MNSDLWFADEGIIRKKSRIISILDRKLHPSIQRARVLGGRIIGNALKYGVMTDLIGVGRKVSHNGTFKQAVTAAGTDCDDIVVVRNQFMKNQYFVARMDGYQAWPYYIDPPAIKDIRVLAACEKVEERDHLRRNVAYYFSPSMEELKSRIIDVRMFPIVDDIGLFNDKGVSRLGLAKIRFGISGDTIDFPLYETNKKPFYGELAQFLEGKLDNFREGWP